MYYSVDNTLSDQNLLLGQWPFFEIGRKLIFFINNTNMEKILSLVQKFNKIKFITGTNAVKIFLYAKYQVQRTCIHRAKQYKKWVRKFNIRCVLFMKGSLMTKQFAAKLDTNS